MVRRKIKRYIDTDSFCTLAIFCITGPYVNHSPFQPPRRVGRVSVCVQLESYALKEYSFIFLKWSITLEHKAQQW